ncbi:unnamed protein product, partial [Musa acuminata var. zebrina]
LLLLQLFVDFSLPATPKSYRNEQLAHPRRPSRRSLRAQDVADLLPPPPPASDACTPGTTRSSPTTCRCNRRGTDACTASPSPPPTPPPPPKPSPRRRCSSARPDTRGTPRPRAPRQAPQSSWHASRRQPGWVQLGQQRRLALEDDHPPGERVEYDDPLQLRRLPLRGARPHHAEDDGEEGGPPPLVAVFGATVPPQDPL